MSKQSCAKAIVKALEVQGVHHIFIGPPGEHVVELYDEILSSKIIKGYLTTNEFTLSFMADGYSRASGEVGVFTCVPGPGVTNALSGITEAFTDSSPVVGIISDVRAHIEESFQLHQMPNLQVLAPVIKKGFRVEDPEEVPRIVAEAFQIAKSGEPGPVMIEIPCDVYPMYGKSHEVKIQLENPPVDHQKIKQFSDLIKNSKRVGIYVGRGCYHYDREVKELSEKLQAPVATSISGRGILSEAEPLSVGFGFGPNGSKIAREVFKECDTVLAMGCKFAEVSSGSFSFKLPKTFIHVDINPNSLNKVFKTEHALVSDAGIFLRKLLEELEGFEKPEDKALKEKIQNGKEDFYNEILHTPINQERVDPGKFYVELRNRLDPWDTLTVDIGNHELWAISCFKVLNKGTFLCPTNFSSMGFAIPSAIAAKIVRPKNRAVCCVGDGGFLMSGFEIITAVRNQLPVIFFVFNDGALGITKGLQERIFRRPAYTELENPDFEKISMSFGMDYVKIKSDNDVNSALNEILGVKRPILAEVLVSYEKLSPFLKGILGHRIKVTPWPEKLHVAKRFVRRTVFPQ